MAASLPDVEHTSTIRWTPDKLTHSFFRKSKRKERIVSIIVWLVFIVGCCPSAFNLAGKEYIPDCGDGAHSDGAQAFFSINAISFSSLTYNNARLIDLAWDLVVCQGGRLLHLWLLTSHILPAALTRSLERSTLSYKFLITMAFSASSLSGVKRAVRELCRRRAPREKATLLWLLITIIYSLAFPTIWGAATGYVQLSTLLFEMPDGSFVSPDSPLLRRCWSVDDPRISGSPRVFLGNYTSWTAVYNSTWNDDPGLLDDQYLGITAYAMTQDFLRTDLEERGPFSDSADFRTVNQSSYDPSLIWHSAKELNLPSKVQMLQICGPGQNCDQAAPIHDPYSISSVEKRLNTSQSVTIFRNYSDSATNNTLPYNSTLRLNGTEYPLSAPTLDLSANCYSTSWQTCTCYGRTPLAYDLSEKIQCRTADGYSWGFSLKVILTVSVIEGALVIGCWGVWIDAQRNSTLVKQGGELTGTVRNMLLLAANVCQDIQMDPEHSTEKQLNKALDECDAIGHEVRHQGDGSQKVGIFKARQPLRRRKDGKTEDLSADLELQEPPQSQAQSSQTTLVRSNHEI